jgi:hypothetical protein
MYYSRWSPCTTVGGRDLLGPNMRSRPVLRAQCCVRWQMQTGKVAKMPVLPAEV